MKLFTQWRFILLSALFSLLGMGSAWAQLAGLEVGKVYHFTNANYSDKALAATYPNSVAGVAVDKENKSQLWYVAEKNESGYYALRNLAFGTYLQGNGQSSRWTLASTTESNNSWITLETVGNYNAFKGYTHNGYGYAHIDGGSNVVGWTSSATATQWTITEKVMKPAEIQEALNIFNSVPTIQANLDNLFSDKSCTTLKGAFNENDASFKALPATLQAMVRKVAGNNTSWEEANFDESKANWDAEYAKKYRVQLYEPYNEPECAAKALRINAHTNLNNPTGIFANKDDILYVMVEGSIEPGATLYLSYYKGHDRLAGATDGYELKQGLNVIPVYYDESNFCVNYVVNTFDTSKGYGSQAKAHRLSDYGPIKIHIEGGYINGYWNKMGDALYTADTDEDWNYIEARATQQDVVVLGKYMTLKFPLLSVHAENQTAMSQIYNEKIKVSESINEWDNIMLWERFVMGLSTKADLDNSTLVSPYSDKKIFEYTGEDYTDYYNVHGLAYSIESGKNPHAGWDYTGYPNNSMVNINADIFTNAGAHWTAGHEIGHQHQGPLNMRGLTEVTNNLFSNVVLWCFGKSTSRYNGTDGSLTNILQQFNAEGTDFFSNNIWAQTIMYYKLFLYYHVLGHNTQFYPRLYEMLRQNPMAIEYNQDGSTCLMHFYQLCCDAAGEDLTEFFRAHGFFEVMNSRFVGDYSNATYNLTQAQIDQAITEIKAKEYPVNLAVLFINDATGEPILSHRDDVEYLELYNETRTCSEIGSYSNFNSDAANYTYSVTGNSITMEGSGGVGFVILNEKGELIGFSDKKTFDISAEVAAAITSGKASIVTLNADNTPVAATNVMDTGNTEAKYELLGELLGSAKQLFDLSDETGIKVGYYRVSSLTNLQEAYESAKAVYDAQTIAAYSAVYDVLYQEYANLMNNDYARINITEGFAYRLTNKAYPGRSMAVNTENNQMFGIETAESNAQLWYFEAGATPGTYYLKNKATGLYPGNVSTSAVLKADKSDKTTDNGAHAYHLQNMGNGIFVLVGETGLHCSATQSYNIVGWGADADATQWYITAEVVDETLEARLKLEETIAKTEALVNEMAEVKIKGSALDLTTCTITSNTPETGHETKYLVDGNPTTFFHTNWSGAAISENHNFIIDLGEGNSLEQFAFNYITLPSTQNNVDAPKAMVIEGSTNGTDYTSITSLSELPTTKGTTYASATLGTKGTAYRYLRFSVTDATGGKLGSYYYFGLADFGLTNMQTELLSVKDAYSFSQTAILNACDGLYAANLVYNNEIATQAELQTAASALNEDYEALLKAYNDVKEAGLEAKKEELQALIDKTTTLINQCGSVKYNKETTPKLNITAAPYLLTDNNDASEGSLDKLYDGKQGKDFSYTSNWEHALTESPYLQVDLGTGNELEELIFTFTNRTEGNAPTPTKIVVSASADGNTFTPLITYTSEEANWPPAANGGNIPATKWTSPVIEATSACRYWRFTVTKSQRRDGGETNNKGIYHFGISEFGIVIPASCKVTVNEGLGGVTKELLLATYDENQEAKGTLEFATTEAQLDKAIADLQAQYDALLTEAVYRQELREKIAVLAELIDQCGEVAYDAATDTYTATVAPNAGSVTEELLISAAQAKAAAEEVANTSTDQAALIAEKEKLTSHCEALQAAFAIKLYPVTITTDVANPVLYTMKSHRGANKAVQYLPADGHKFNISDESAGSAVQTYYFTVGTEHGQVYVHPYAAGGMVLAANDTGDGADKAFATEKGSAKYDQWKFVKETVTETKDDIQTTTIWYGLQPVGTSTYFSNFGGGSKKMGFYSTADEGSHLQFVSTTVEGTIAYNTLKSYYDGLTLSNITGSEDRVGYYPVEQATAYNQAYNQATVVLNSGGTSEEQYFAAYEALKSANEALDINKPVPGKFYAIKSTSTEGYCAGKYVHAIPAGRTLEERTYDHKTLVFGSFNPVDATALWLFTEDMKMQNLHTGEYVKSFDKDEVHMGTEKDAATITIGWLADNQSYLKIGEHNPMHAQNDYDVIVTWTVEKNNASVWTFEEVDAEDVVYTATIGSSGYAGLHLNYPVVIPKGFEAYYVDSTTESVAKLSRIEGVIPANAGVLLKGEVKASCHLKYSTNPGTDISKSNILKGANYTSYLPGEDGWKYFLFGVKNGVAGFYWSYLNYNANGTIVDSTNGGYNDAGGYFRCTANKIYLPIENTNAASFTLRFNNPTVIEDLLNGLNNEEVIYDIQGRRITKVTESGIYIVNGNKRYIHVK